MQPLIDLTDGRIVRPPDGPFTYIHLLFTEDAQAVSATVEGRNHTNANWETVALLSSASGSPFGIVKAFSEMRCGSLTHRGGIAALVMVDPNPLHPPTE